MNLPCPYVLSARPSGPVVTCGLPVTLHPDGGMPMCDQHAPKPKQCSVVYVVKRGQYVKIGTSTDPFSRIPQVMRGINCVTPQDIDGDPCVLAVVEGDRGTERLLHDAFALHRVVGEWFRDEGSVVEWTARMDPTAARAANSAVGTALSRYYPDQDELATSETDDDAVDF